MSEDKTTAAEPSPIQEVFGQFAVELADGVALFATAAEAELAHSEFVNGAENLALAEEYAASQGLTDKNAKSKINVITSFLTWVDAGRPPAQAEGEAGSEDDVVTTGQGEDGEEVTF